MLSITCNCSSRFDGVDLGLEIDLLVKVSSIVIPEGAGLIEKIHYPRQTFNKSGIYHWVAVRWFW